MKATLSSSFPAPTSSARSTLQPIEEPVRPEIQELIERVENPVKPTNVLIPIMRQLVPELLAEELVSVQPMTGPNPLAELYRALEEAEKLAPEGAFLFNAVRSAFDDVLKEAKQDVSNQGNS